LPFRTQKISHQRSAAATSSSFQVYHSQQQQYNTDAEEEGNTTTSHATTLNTSPTLELQQKKWMFQNKYPIAYEVARMVSVNQDGTCVKNNIEDGLTTMNEGDEVVPILLLNGFGVGSFHQHRLMRQLLLQHEEYNQQQQQQQQLEREKQQHQQPQQHQQQQQQQQRRQHLVVYGIDYLGQGNSWPVTCNGDGTSEDELNLGYSADIWLDQLKDFIDEVVLSSSPSSSLTASPLSSTATETVLSSSSSSSINNPNQKNVHLIGNSVGLPRHYSHPSTSPLHRVTHFIECHTSLGIEFTRLGWQVASTTTSQIYRWANVRFDTES
jgi:hypothetical protein